MSIERSEMKIGIIGAGPVGSIMAGYLAKKGESVLICDINQNLLNGIKAKGLEIRFQNSKFKVQSSKFRIYNSISKLLKFKPDFIFIATKTGALKSVIQEIQNSALRIPNSAFRWVILQNGIDNEDLIAENFGKENVIRIVVNYAGSIIKPGKVRMTFFNPPNYIGGLTAVLEPKAKALAKIITDAGLKTEFTTDIKKYEWQKSILNAALGTVCAVTGMDMRAAMEFSLSRELCEKILKEAIAVAKKVGYDYGPDFFDSGIKYFLNAGAHKPSILIDLESKRPTEIDFINQKILDYGIKYRVNTPYLDALTSIIRAIEKTHISYFRSIAK